MDALFTSPFHALKNTSPSLCSSSSTCLQITNESALAEVLIAKLTANEAYLPTFKLQATDLHKNNTVKLP